MRKLEKMNSEHLQCLRWRNFKNQFQSLNSENRLQDLNTKNRFRNLHFNWIS